jgi:putative transcriptional regulator
MDDQMFAELEASLKEGMAILRGEEKPSRAFSYEVPDVKALRENFKLTQQQFAALIGISVRTLQNWEQGRRVPEGPARVLLMVAARNPQAVLDAVQAARERTPGTGGARVYPVP